MTAEDAELLNNFCMQLNLNDNNKYKDIKYANVECEVASSARVR